MVHDVCSFDRDSYLAENSYPLYILHQTVIVVVAFYLVGLPGGGAAEWVLLLALSVVVTFGLYEVVRRVAPLRFLFGMKKARTTAWAPEVETTPSDAVAP